MAVKDDNQPTPRLALSIEQACEALSVSWDTWRRHIAPDIRVVYIGRKKLVPVTELERWLEANAVSTAAH